MATLSVAQLTALRDTFNIVIGATADPTPAEPPNIPGDEGGTEMVRLGGKVLCLEGRFYYYICGDFVGGRIEAKFPPRPCADLA